MALELAVPGARAVVLPEHGGRLHQLFVRAGDAEWALLFAPDDPAEYALWPDRGGAFPMAPWPNRVRDGAFSWRGHQFQLPRDREGHALHGRAYRLPWRVVANTGRTCELAVDFDEAWPWPGRAWQRVDLEPGRLRLKLEVRATREAFPAGAGWHPWFRRAVAGSAAPSLTLPAKERYVQHDGLPTGERVPVAGAFDLRERAVLDPRRELDACFTALDGPVVLEWDRLRLAIAIEAAVPHVQLFTPPFAVCVEPQTCAPDAFNLAAAGVANTGMAVAEPGRAVSLASTWTWELR